MRKRTPQARMAAIGAKALRILDVIVSTLLVDTTQYPKEYDWTRALPW